MKTLPLFLVANLDQNAKMWIYVEVVWDQLKF